MIGQKGFFKTNSSSNVNLNDAIISSGSNTAPASAPSPAPDPASSTAPSTNFPAQKEKKPLPVKTILIAVAAALVGAGVAVGVVLIINNTKKQEGITQEITYSSPDNDGTQTNEETLAEFDKAIDNAKDESESFSLLLNKVGYNIIIADYDAALAILDGINLSELDDFDQYRVYNYYTSAYKEMGNTAKAEQYQKLADEANARDFAKAGETAE